MTLPTGRNCLPFTVLNVFTSSDHHGGNPLAIIHIPSDLSKKCAITAAQKQLIARDFNLSEVVYLHEVVFLHEDVPASTDHDGKEIMPIPGTAKIDLFLSYMEVPFAGHPAIGVADYILRYLAKSPDPQVFTRWRDVNTILTRAGPLAIAPYNTAGSMNRSICQGARVRIPHNIHSHQPRLRETNILANFDQTCRANFTDADIAKCPVVSLVKDMTVVLVKLNNLEALRDQAGMSILGPLATYTQDAVQQLLDPGWQTGIVTTYFFVDLGFQDTSSGKVKLLRTRMFGSREDSGTGYAGAALCGSLSLTEQYDTRVRSYRIHQGVEMGSPCEIGVEIVMKDSGDEIESLFVSGTTDESAEGVLKLPELISSTSTAHGHHEMYVTKCLRR